SKSETPYSEDLLKGLIEVSKRQVDDLQSKFDQFSIILLCLAAITQHKIRLESNNLLNIILGAGIRDLGQLFQTGWVVRVEINGNDFALQTERRQNLAGARNERNDALGRSCGKNNRRPIGIKNGSWWRS